MNLKIDRAISRHDGRYYMSFAAVMWSVWAFLLPVTTRSAQFGEIDQQNVGIDIYTGGALAPFSFGQSFTPSLPAIDAIEFLLGGTDAAVVVRLRDSVAGTDGLAGTIIAESLPEVVEFSGDKWFHFDFPNRVSLTPGQQYVAELYFTTGLLGVRALINDPYAGGQYFSQGFPGHLTNDTDLIFREGLHVPEPAAATMVGCVVSIGLLRRRRFPRGYSFNDARR